MSLRLQIEAVDGQSTIERRLESWEAERFGPRLWRKDPTLWFSEPHPELEDRLDSLDLLARMGEVAPELEAFSAMAQTSLRSDFEYRSLRETYRLSGAPGRSLPTEGDGRSVRDHSASPRQSCLDSKWECHVPSRRRPGSR